MLELSRAEAIVLFDFLSRDAVPDSAFADTAERTALWKVEAQLDKLLTEPLAPNYKQLLADARRRVRGDNEGAAQ
jgi:hypothetical protein